jgi:hypothetical protein
VLLNDTHLVAACSCRTGKWCCSIQTARLWLLKSNPQTSQLLKLNNNCNVFPIIAEFMETVTKNTETKDDDLADYKII